PHGQSSSAPMSRAPWRPRSRYAKRCVSRDRFCSRAPFATVSNDRDILRSSLRSDVYLKATKGFLLSLTACLWTVAASAQVTPPPAPTAPAAPGTPPATGLPLGISNYSSWKFERVGDHLHLINQAAIEGPNLKFFA